ncbi:MAG: acyltransferase family protein [Acidimicrobiia bacterium]
MTSTDADAPNHLTYQPSLDGLRAVAVVAVVVFHLRETGLTGGFLGVDTFFVLSGFLITTLLVLEWRRHAHIGIVAFWGRRARRLLPALVLLMVAVAIFARIDVASTEFHRLRWDGIAGLFYVANWRFVVSHQSYFELFSAASPFRHLWSLAIEEQFYLVWPLVTAACLALGRGRLRWLAVTAAVGTIASTVAMAVLYRGDDPSRAYYGTDTHAHPILIGTLLALVLIDRPAASARLRRWLDALGVVALVVMIAAFAFAHSASPRLYRGGSLLFALAVAGLIVSIMRAPGGVVARLLALRPLVLIGVISYGIYLWHWPVIVYATEARVGVSGFGLDLIRVGITLAISVASYLLVERPIRHGLAGRATWIAAPAGIAAGVLAVVFATTGATAAPAYFGSTPIPTPSTTLGPAEPGNPTRAVLIGDSLAASLGPGLDDAMTARGVPFATAAQPGCSVLRGVTVGDDGTPYPWSHGCASAMQPALRAVVGASPAPDLVIWLSTWDAVDRDLGGHRVKIGTPSGRVVLSREVRQAADLLTRHGARLVILTVPAPVPGTAAALPGLDEASRIARLNDLYRRAGPTRDGRVSVFDLQSIVCPDGRCPVRVAGIELRPDGSHFGPEGSQYVGRKLTDAVLRCWRTPTTCGT